MSLEQAFAGSNINDNWRALYNTLELFRQVAIEVGEHLGYAYPETLHSRVKAYIGRIRQMARSIPEGR